MGDKSTAKAVAILVILFLVIGFLDQHSNSIVARLKAAQLKRQLLKDMAANPSQLSYNVLFVYFYE